MVSRLKRLLCRMQKRYHLRKLRRWAIRNKGVGTRRVGPLNVEYTDPTSLYVEFKDIFFHQIYHFTVGETQPLIIDGGGCIGISSLYFKKIAPQARILAFEPDDDIAAIFQRNMLNNGYSDVTLIKAGLAAQDGVAHFSPDGSDGGLIQPETENNKLSMTIPTKRLSPYIEEPIAFLKLNIEGQELPVLKELVTEDKLKLVRETVIEYHGWANGEQCLGEILSLLNEQGFRYVIHDFDKETCSATKPPFDPRPDRTWFCLIAARNTRFNG